ncbi:DUF6968 family protein [Caulobacter soli]|uniref:DUF6968 family protein n=1 Tax=Caulobacter soli TaxID=2708539 RepID=UPI0013EA36D2|nr:hypothetical protein [Caulobacter soli]
MRRVLQLDEVDAVQVEIFSPVEDVGSFGDYLCRFKINGLGKNVEGYGAGIDSINALVGALIIIGNKLYTTEEYKSGRLSWSGSIDRGKLGFPTAGLINW